MISIGSEREGETLDDEMEARGFKGRRVVIMRGSVHHSTSHTMPQITMGARAAKCPTPSLPHPTQRKHKHSSSLVMRSGSGCARGAADGGGLEGRICGCRLPVAGCRFAFRFDGFQCGLWFVVHR